MQGITIFDGEQSAWTRGRRSGTLRNIDVGGKSIQSHINEANKPSYSFFESLELPREIIAPKYRNGLGRTAITINGFVDQLYAEISEEEEQEEPDKTKEPK